MVTENTRILVTGEYWHEDFQGLISSRSATITLCPLERLGSLGSDECFDLMVLCQSRRGVVSAELVESIQDEHPTVPKVALLGSWCEGEVRSGTPWPGVPRVYWHQWQGRFEEFLNCLEKNQIHDWQLPATAVESDHAQHSAAEFGTDEFQGLIAVSAWTKTQYDMIEDALNALGAKCCWVERTTWDGEAKSLVKAVVVDDDSLTSNLENRIRWIFSVFGAVPIVLSLGFPRKDEIQQLAKMGVGAVVSKPFKLGDLKQAVLLATGEADSSADRANQQGPVESA